MMCEYCMQAAAFNMQTLHLKCPGDCTCQHRPLADRPTHVKCYWCGKTVCITRVGKVMHWHKYMGFRCPGSSKEPHREPRY